MIRAVLIDLGNTWFKIDHDRFAHLDAERLDRSSSSLAFGDNGRLVDVVRPALFAARIGAVGARIGARENNNERKRSR
jgi:hypothetical protein